MDKEQRILRRIRRKVSGTTEAPWTAKVAKNRCIVMGLEAKHGGEGRAQKVFDQLFSEMNLKGGLGNADGIMLYISYSKKFSYVMREARIIEYEFLKIFRPKTPIFSFIYNEDNHLKDQLSVALLLWEKLL